MPHHDELPRLTALDDATLARARTVTVHSPDSSREGDLVWTLTVSDGAGTPLGRDRLTAPDWPTPLGDLIAPHLDVAGLRVVGRWRTDLGDDDLPRHAARVEPGG
ncbi:hypothetical protein KQI48_02130 [Cellulomonas hominis]|uniref:Uncharacterized protein n=1 Tax=Cellulomonas hominis TaxID=156981 RepID=A0A511F9R9_9CELL|nr:hypothetical protein [Cellulomonas hominis]MBB5473532.1 hypothetical protein [Cellulomonas hominis]MBU5421457.1 hypothetical protein [Cellulomonas hominis]NKY07038.1 hypothetical protein [Cellulomonas hominis]NKY10567.1 hypothetical protein [Cellulomonas hominis]GEL46006.1 hypothetical protein CHO01_11220 [Cellulomonas hominis]